MKLIFLDIDGVICNIRQNFDPEAVARIKRICSETGAKICLSSYWRTSEKLRNKVWDTFEPTRVTPQFVGLSKWRELERTAEILDVLRNTDVTNFVVIDDSNMPAFGHRMIRTMFEELITDDQTTRAIQVLNESI